MVTSCGVHLPHDVVMVGVDCAVVGASGLIGLGVVGMVGVAVLVWVWGCEQFPLLSWLCALLLPVLHAMLSACLLSAICLQRENCGPAEVGCLLQAERAQDSQQARRQPQTQTARARPRRRYAFCSTHQPAHPRQVPSTLALLL
jgi:hypothetical protein